MVDTPGYSKRSKEEKLLRLTKKYNFLGITEGILSQWGKKTTSNRREIVTPKRVRQFQGALNNKAKAGVRNN